MKTDCSAAYGLSEMSVGEVEASRIASSDTGHYILIRAKDLASSSSQRCWRFIVVIKRDQVGGMSQQETVCRCMCVLL